MAKRTRRSYGAELNQKIKAEVEKGQEKADEVAKGPIALDGVTASIWRKLVSYAIDLFITVVFISSMFFMYKSSDLPVWQRVMGFIGLIVVPIWMFGMVPTISLPGQTMGKRLMRLYTRDVHSLEYIPFWKSILREGIYGAYAAIITIPLEFGFIIFQLFKKDAIEKTTTQATKIFSIEVLLLRDMIFKSETVYLAKKKK